MNLSPLAITEVPTRLRTFAKTRTADFWLFESSLWLHVFASSLISIFIPVLLLSNGFTVQSVFLFYIFYHGFNIPANYLGRFITRRFSAKTSIILGTISTIIFFLLYSGVETMGLLVMIAFFYALYDGLYYVPSLYLFMNSTKDPENTGENTGILHLVTRSAGLVGPILGSILVIASGGNRTVVVAVMVLFFIFSLIPLFFLKELEKGEPEKPISWKEFFSNRRERKNHQSFALYKISEAAELIIFPMFIFLTFEDLSSVAILAVLIPIVSLVFSYAASHIKRTQREKIIMIGAAALAAVWFARFLIDSQIMFYATNVLTGLFALFILVPLDANMFLRGAERGALSASMFRNISSMGAKLLLFIVLFILVNNFYIPFAVAFIALLGLIYVNYAYLEWRERQPGSQTSVVGLPTKND